LTDLPNVGRVLEQNLLAAGITTPEQLREVGVKEAFIRIKMQDPTACVQMLYGLAGAVEGIRGHASPGGLQAHTPGIPQKPLINTKVN